MNIQIEISLKDYIAAQALHAERSVSSRLFYVLARYIYPVIGICFLLLALLLSTHDSRHQSSPMLIASGAFLLLCPLILYFNTKRSYKRTMANSGRCDVSIDEDLIRTSGSNTKSELSWDAIKEFREGGSVFLLYLAPGRFLVLPKRAFSDMQIEELRSLLLRKVRPGGREETGA